MGWTRRIGIGATALGLGGALVWALWPQPAAVDMAVIGRGDLQVSVAAEGVTRVREPYAVTAPITGIVERLPVAVGDIVRRGETTIALIRPAEPALMDARSRAQAEAAVREAEAALALAETNLRRALTTLTHGQSELTRARALAQAGTISQRALEDAEAAFTEASQAQLIAPDGVEGVTNALRLSAPISGTVLSVEDPSARLVQAGAPLLSLGDLQDLEIEIDLLSADAVQVAEGAPAWVDRWGGAGSLQAVVRRIEPAAFTRVSALGIEEQRVRLRLDFLTPPEGRAGLGDRYRVFVRVVTWEGADRLLVPEAALFRHGEGWAVFRVAEGRATLTPVETGHRAGGQVEVLGGLTQGDTVILYPASSLVEGGRVTPRP